MNLRRVLAVARKEWREILRDRIFFTLAFLLPPVLMVVFGYGMTQEVEHVPIAVVDYDHSPSSRDYAQLFIQSRYFDFQGYLPSDREAARRLADGTLRVALIIPEQFHQRLAQGGTAEAQTLMDGTLPITTRTIRSYVDAINAASSADLQAASVARRLGVSLERARGMLQPVRLDVRYLYNQEARSIWTIAPLVILVIMMWTTPLLVSVSVVREKETGALYNIATSTISRAEYLAGKALPNILINTFNIAILWLIATRYFHAPFKGSLGVFTAATVLFVICGTGLGLLVSLLVKTQQAALMVVVILGTMIATEYSGLYTPIADLRGATWLVAHAFPAMYYANVIEGAFLRGAGWGELWKQVLILGIYGTVVLFLAHRWFHKISAA